MWSRLSLSAKVSSAAVAALTLLMVVSVAFYDASLNSNADRMALERQDTNMRVAWRILQEFGGPASTAGDRLYVGGHPLNNDFATVDLIKKLVGGTATVFQGDRRIATNLRLPDGRRAVGTRLAAGPVYDAVLRRGSPYRGKATILGTPFYTAYDPIKDAAGHVIGILYVGIPQAEFLKPIHAIQVNALLIGLGVTAVFAYLGVLLCRWLFRPLSAVQSALERTMGGDVTALVPGSERGDDVGALARAVVAFQEKTKENLRATAAAEAERSKAEAARLQTEAAEAANRAKTEFLAMMSHEIRTPLNGVLGMAQVMERDRLSKKQRERLEIISRCGENLLCILNDILDISKIEAGKIEFEEGEFDIEDLTRGAFEAFTVAAAEKGLAFTLDVKDLARGRYRGDPVRVRQIIFNLVSNAVKFTQAGRVDVIVDRHLDGVRITVHDTGLGIAPGRIGRLFEKFVQADASTTRRFGGAGLGLSICAQLASAMGGRIEASSAPGVGSDFVAWLPLRRVSEGAAPRGADLGGPQPSLFERCSDLRILAAEDNAVNQLVLRSILSGVGASPVIVADGAEALEACAVGAWDVILMDVQMPVMDGPTAARAIRALEARTGRSPTPIIALSANAMTHQVEDYLAAGMTGFVAKPIKVAELLGAILAALEPAPVGVPGPHAAGTGGGVAAAETTVQDLRRAGRA